VSKLEDSFGSSSVKDLEEERLDTESNFPRGLSYGLIFCAVLWTGSYFLGKEILDYFSPREQYSLNPR